MAGIVTKMLRLIANPDKLRVKLLALISVRRMNAKLEGLSLESDLNRYPVIWIRTPKCASSSIIRLLSATNTLVDLIKNPEADLSDPIVKSKVICISAGNMGDFISRYPLIWQQSFKWAVVRNPYERAISAWQYLDSLKKSSLDEVLLSPPSESRPDEYHHFTRSFTSMLSRDGVIVTDATIKFEELSERLPVLFEKLGIPFVGLPRVNATPGKKIVSAEHLTESQRVAIRKLYADDFVSFQYPE